MHDDSGAIEARIDRNYRDRIAPSRYSASVPVTVEAWEAPGEPIPFAEAIANAFTPFETGTAWGRPWGTTWLHVTGEVPGDWAPDDRRELTVDLGFTGAGPGFQAEGLVWSPDGEIIKGLEPRNNHVRITAGPGEFFELYIEAASNPDFSSGGWFTPSPLGDLDTAGREPLYRFAGAQLGLLDAEAFHLERDVWTLRGMLPTLPTHSARRARILRALERSVDVLDPDDVTRTAPAARAELAGVLSDTAPERAHKVVAIGHAHIDSAWLWPIRETIRKCARTFSNVLDLMDDYEEFVFVASSAQQYAWMRDHYPALFERIRTAVKAGRFVPVGGMWVESDTNMPGGEALARQLTAGKGFFIEEFGVEPNEVWLPDSFGYSAGMPQIIAAAGTEYFLTQKISWNETNRMPHHTFLWEGIDGTRVFTHMPPVATYNSELSGEELAKAEQDNAERGLLDLSLVPYGFGDGGGGPTREMVEVARRKADLEGSPKVELTTPAAFFAEARDELAEPAIWSGELYLEFHRGTYTSQSRTKQGNRRSEHLLREAELWSATASVRTGAEYPAAELRAAWETVLLQQFHDILPGSSIAWVHQEAERNYAAVAVSLEVVIARAIAALGGSEVATAAATGQDDSPLAFNASPFPVDGVPALAAGNPVTASTSARADGDGFVLESSRLTARLDADGHLVSLIDAATGRDAVPLGALGNDVQFFRDIPNQWDAWDIDVSYQRVPIDAVRTVEVSLEGDVVTVSREVGSSTLSQRIGLSPDGSAVEIETTVEWAEHQKLLKLAFPFDVHADGARSEVQFGHVRRPIHANTSWDMARFETSAHRWVHVEEPGFGVTVANDRVYGHDITRSTRVGGGSTTVIRESLLRAPRFPDPEADQGHHVFRHSIVVGELIDGIAEGYRLNLPLRSIASGRDVAPLVSVDSPSVVVEAVKLADDGSGDVVVRLYETRGGRARARLEAGFASSGALRTDLLERTLPDQPDDALSLDLRAFEIVTLRLARSTT